MRRQGPRGAPVLEAWKGSRGISERVGELQRAVETPTSQGFTQLLTSQLGQPTVAQGATAPVLAPAVKLGQMLGPSPASFTPGPPVAVGAQSVGAVGPGGLMNAGRGPLPSRLGMRAHAIAGNPKLHAGVDRPRRPARHTGAAMAGTVTYAGPRGALRQPRDRGGA